MDLHGSRPSDPEGLDVTDRVPLCCVFAPRSRSGLSGPRRPFYLGPSVGCLRPQDPWVSYQILPPCRRSACTREPWGTPTIVTPSSRSCPGRFQVPFWGERTQMTPSLVPPSLPRVSLPRLVTVKGLPGESRARGRSGVSPHRCSVCRTQV